MAKSDMTNHTKALECLGKMREQPKVKNVFTGLGDSEIAKSFCCLNEQLHELVDSVGCLQARLRPLTQERVEKTETMGMQGTGPGVAPMTAALVELLDTVRGIKQRVAEMMEDLRI